MRQAVLAVVLAALAVAPATAQVTGFATVLSSDALSINGQTFQLHGVEGLEFHQYCFVDGRPWACGAAATRALQTLLDLVVVSCAPTGETNGGAMFAVCSIREGDVADIMVRRGWALANRLRSDQYAGPEADARERRAGAWRGAFVEPWVYREDIAAIERRYAERALEPLRAEAERAITADRGGITVFEGFTITRGLETVDHEFHVAEAGSLLDAIGPGEVFTWETVARALQSWRESAAAAIVGNVVQSLWTELGNRPRQLAEVVDGATYHAALIANAAAWIATGRQPVLIVAQADNPTWIGDWFDGKAPAGATVTRKEAITDPDYLGTIDGIDVYVGAAPYTGSLLFPNDLLIWVAYRPHGDGAILALTRDEVPDPPELVIRYSQANGWLGDEVVHIAYPYEIAVPYGS